MSKVLLKNWLQPVYNFETIENSLGCIQGIYSLSQNVLLFTFTMREYKEQNYPNVGSLSSP